MLLEYLIGDADMPTNENENETDSTKEKYMKGLNESQRKAFLMSVDGSPVSLIKGPPGTGKTHVINAIVQYITKELGEKVIISSQTHIAIDNVIDKLMSNNDPIIPKRITNRRNDYSEENIDATLYKTWGNNFAEHNKLAQNKWIANQVASLMKKFDGEKRFSYSKNMSAGDYQVIGVTTTSTAISGKRGLKVLDGYNWLIIDEVSKCPITEVLRYLPYVEKIIMVGDDFQLAPLLEFSKEDVKDLEPYDENKFQKLKVIYEDSVFAKTLRKAQKCNRMILLNENYRSVNDVMHIYNMFYDGKLQGRRETTRPEKIHIKSKILDDNKDVFFIEVKNGKELRGENNHNSRYNIEEIEATTYILKDLMKTVENPIRVSVAAIFPYGAQIEEFMKRNKDLVNESKKLFKSFEIDTVDAFQGKEADIVLCNTVLADKTKINQNFLTDFRRINVSMSRAKDKLIIFGNHWILENIEMSVANGNKRKFFQNIIDYIRANGKLITYDGGKVYENRSKNTIDFA